MEVQVVRKITATKTTLAVILIVAAMSILPGSASAAWLHNQKGYYVPACGAAGCPYGTNYMVRNGTYFAMSCWTNSSWRYGNYWTNRWFQGYVSGIQGKVFIPASYVYYQTAVRYC